MVCSIDGLYMDNLAKALGMVYMDKLGPMQCRRFIRINWAKPV